MVGLFVGVVWFVPSIVVGDRFGSAGVTAALILIADALITGGLHLDAMADVADGAASRRSGEEGIVIMRDPTIGALGAAALILICLLRYGALTFSGNFGFRLFAAPVAGRVAMVLLIATMAPARTVRWRTCSAHRRGLSSRRPPSLRRWPSCLPALAALLPSGLHC